MNDVVERTRGLIALLGEAHGRAVLGGVLVLGVPHLDEAVLGKMRHGARHRRATHVDQASKLGGGEALRVFDQVVETHHVRAAKAQALCLCRLDALDLLAEGTDDADKVLEPLLPTTLSPRPASLINVNRSTLCPRTGEKNQGARQPRDIHIAARAGRGGGRRARLFPTGKHPCAAARRHAYLLLKRSPRLRADTRKERQA